ncbi:hypothetical protein GCM10007415_13480 [Parapedobacter pyrenivorans]|uniref:Galactose mutarotase n=1 Tax=Parapedobacter pyrenivorans TaxID=1305674 RepID=A0A917M794_9SPHI|nr:hypothetical protein [Parapedobacter pyrenivorans]GGG82013.1 hypothetical protein GCM10007415_13480 [Parapedobacter pyrenivorans]
MKKELSFLFLVVGVLSIAKAGDRPFPSVKIANGVVQATLYLPDTSVGFYRGTRFDWSGVIPELVYEGHQYHGEWFTEHDPLGHDGIVGPVEEFTPLGFEQAAIGDAFVKIGVGSLVKPDEKPYAFHRRYAFSDRGRWQVKAGKQQVDFTHVLNTAGYAYVYKKTVQLPDGAAKMVLTHSLENTGEKVIETRVYNHNFFVIDKEPTGPGYRITLPGDTLHPIGAKGLNDIARLEGNELIFLRTLKRGEQAYFADLGGGQPVDYDITVRNVKSGAGVRITGDRPISKMVFWSSPTTVCPEPYLDVRVAPGETYRWTIAYEYHRNTQ